MSTKIKFFLGALVVAAFAVTASAGAQTYSFSGTLKQGSKGVSVWNLQKFLNMCPTTKVAAMGAGSPGMETQTFGPATKAAVIRFQAANGLSADGIFGSMSAAKAMSLQVSGNPCGGSVVVNPPAGLPTGCTSTMGYSPVTGQSCAGGSTSTPSTGSLSGTDGIISDVNMISSYNNEKVGEGENNVKVGGFEVEASNDGDIALKSVKVSFTYTSNGSNRLNRYIDGVSVWQGSTKVGSADAEDFNKDSSGVYSKTITLDNAVVRADKTEKFYVSVDAASTLDSGDIDDSSEWDLGIDSVRFVDGSGVVTTDSTAGDLPISGVGINFVDFNTAADTELRFSKDSDSPVAGIVVVDDQDSTDNVTLLKGTLKLQGDSDVTINELPVTFTTTGHGLASIASNLTLVIDGEEYTESPVATTAGTATVVFDNLDFNLSAGDTVDFEVKADINGTTDFSEGDKITASITSNNRDAVDVENEQGDQVLTNDKVGTVTGDAQEFRSQGVSATLVSTNETSNSDATLATYTIKFKVSAVGDDAYIGTTASKYVYTLTDASGNVATIAGGFSAAIANDGGSGNSTTTTSGGNWKINEGTSVNLTLTVFANSNLPAGAYRANLTGVKWDSDDTDASLANTYSSNMDDFHTDFEQLI